ncbi:endonuclease NucS [Candidatus Woesearchaeota archaeon]|nr:endonuclease NucS [Candidatus Woesearchaeota archaeon]
MKPEEYQTLLNDALTRNETIVFSCKCRIRYSGRAESFLDWGDRLIMIKSDNTLLVHQPTGNTPINYMKPGSSFTLRHEHDQLVLKSQNITQKETMETTISKMHFFNSHKLEDGQIIRVSGTEEDMSNMIYANPEMIEEGFKPVSQEEQTKYGFIDVMGVDKNGMLTVVECKRYRAELSAVTQLRRYVEKIMVSKGITKVRGILAAPKITANAEKMLKDWGFDFISVKPPKYLEEYDKKQSKLDGF